MSNSFDPMDCSLPDSSDHGDSPAKNIGVSCHALLQGIFPTQGSKLHLLHCKQILYHLSHKRSPNGTGEEVESENEVAQSCPTLCDPWTVAHQAPPSMGFSRQEYWSGLPFPFPGDLPNPGIKPRSPTLQADTLTSAPPGKPREEVKRI